MQDSTGHREYSGEPPTPRPVDTIGGLRRLCGDSGFTLQRKADGFGWDVYIPGFRGDEREITERLFLVSDGPVTVFRFAAPAPR